MDFYLIYRYNYHNTVTFHPHHQLWWEFPWFVELKDFDLVPKALKHKHLLWILAWPLFFHPISWRVSPALSNLSWFLPLSKIHPTSTVERRPIDSFVSCIFVWNISVIMKRFQDLGEISHPGPHFILKIPLKLGIVAVISRVGFSK